MADFDGGRVFGLSILMLLIKLQTAFREIYVDANRKIRVVKRIATSVAARTKDDVLIWICVCLFI